MSEPDPLELVRRLEAQLSPEALQALHMLRSLTDAGGLDLYLVGGAVRDLLLQRPNLDLDLAIEADVAPIAEALASATGGRAVLHARFGTSTISGPGFHLDLARTRRETYAHPGALPTVEPASIEDDLARRDFTINAMALQLSGPRLIDTSGGLNDLTAGLIRVLHEASFRDDPTRMLRAARYATRLGYSLEASTAVSLERDVESIERVSAARIRNELLRIFEEPKAVDALVFATKLSILTYVDVKLGAFDASNSSTGGGFGPGWRAALDGPPLAPLDEFNFCMLQHPSTDAEVRRISKRLALKGRIQDALSDFAGLLSEDGGWDKLAAMIDDPVAIVERLDRRRPSAVWATSVIGFWRGSNPCERYLTEWRHVKPLLRGDDLLALGVQPGVAVGDMLRALRNARLTGAATTREDEEALVRVLLQKTAP